MWQQIDGCCNRQVAKGQGARVMPKEMGKRGDRSSISYSLISVFEYLLINIHVATLGLSRSTQELPCILRDLSLSSSTDSS